MIEQWQFCSEVVTIDCPPICAKGPSYIRWLHDGRIPIFVSCSSLIKLSPRNKVFLWSPTFWWFPKIGGPTCTHKSSIFMGFSTINYIHLGVPPFMETTILVDPGLWRSKCRTMSARRLRRPPPRPVKRIGQTGCAWMGLGDCATAAWSYK